VLILHQANINALKFFPGLVSRIYDGEVLVYTGITNIGNASSGSTAYGLAACLDDEDDGTGDTIRIKPDYRVLLVGFGSGMNIHGVAIQFCVEGIAHAILPYDEAANVETCDVN